MNSLRKLFENKKNYYNLILALLMGFLLIFISETLFSTKSKSISKEDETYINSSSNNINKNPS